MLSDATLIYIKASCAEGERLATDTTMELIDEVRKLRSEIARFREGMPDKSTLDCAAESLAQWACKHADDDCAWCADTTVEWLRRLAAGGERE